MVQHLPQLRHALEATWLTGDAAAKGGGYSDSSSKPAASTSKVAEKKAHSFSGQARLNLHWQPCVQDMFAEVDDFLKELDGGTGSGK